jgi:predicted transcriptional regulator
VNNHGFEPTQGDRDTLTYQLACDLRHICGKNADWLDQVIPCYDGFTPEEKRAKIQNALSSEYNGFPLRLRNVLNALTMSPKFLLEQANKFERGDDRGLNEGMDDDDSSDPQRSNLKGLGKMPQGIRESIDAVGPQLTMPVVTAVCPCIGALATGVTLDVHGQKKGLNLIAYIAGDFASGKGNIDPVVDAWMSEVQALDDMYTQQEEEWRKKKKASVNKKDQPEEPMLPIRNLTLNNTVANLAQQLANTEGKHAFSFTPEADTVAQKWKSSMSDFSVMLRQSYDGSKYDRRAKSVDAVNVHIKRLLWNVTMCGTPDALYRVVSNYTDGFQSRIALARTPDNTFAQLEDKPPVLTDRQRERIQQIAHLLPLMSGDVVLPKLEAKGREWLERIRLETMKNDDRTKARQRFRVCVTAQRMTCCLMLCKVCETLIQKHGLNGAETKLKQQPGLWKEMLVKAQTPTMLEAYDVIADSLMENALYFFRDRIENAFQSRDYAGNQRGERTKRGRNDSIYERLDPQFTFEQAMQQSVAVKGANVNHNTVRQMLKNWRKQGLIVQEEDGNYRKVNG